MSTHHQKRDVGLENITKEEGVALVVNALNRFLTSDELTALIDARVKAALPSNNLFGGLPDQYPDYKTSEELRLRASLAEDEALHGEAL